MQRVFNLHNNIALKFQEIQYGFIDGVEFMLGKCEVGPEVEMGLLKLWSLKKAYEEQLLEAADCPDKVKDIAICFRCYDKPNGICHDCD